MSELKVFTFGLGRYTEDGYPCVVAVDGEGNPRLASDEEFYLKSEADKVIAKLKKACKDKDDWCLHTLKENRHHKYKRCLAMAAKYLWKRNYWRDSTPAYERQHQWENMAYKHYKRWLEYAKKFKEAK